MSPPFMFLFDDDRVTCHMGADAFLGDVVDA